MRIDHVALWTDDLERCKRFYVTYFGATAGSGYVNAATGFESCFLSFTDGARIEAMKTMNQIPAPRSGRVTQIIINDGQPVEFGEPLMIVE